MLLLMCCWGALLLPVYTAPSVPNDWVEKTAWLESRNDDNAVGDRGRSRGRYQIQKTTWQRYSTKKWERWAHDAVESRRVCRLILSDCARACVRHGQRVTFQQCRWYYRHGGF